MTAIPRVLLSEERCKGCGCIFARVPRPDLDSKRCGFCIAHLDADELAAAVRQGRVITTPDRENVLLGEPETVKAA